MEGWEEREKLEHKKTAWLVAQLISSGIGQYKKRPPGAKDTFRRLTESVDSGDTTICRGSGVKLKAFRKAHFEALRKKKRKKEA